MTLVLLGILIISIWGVFYVRKGYHHALDIKQQLDRNNLEVMADFRKQEDTINAKKAAVEKSLADLQALPSNHANRKSINGLKKQLNELEDQLEKVEANKEDYLAVKDKYKGQ